MMCEMLKLERIVIVTKRDVKNHGGGGDIYVHEIAKRLIDEFDVTILTSNVSNDFKVEFIDGVRVVRLSKSVPQMRLMIPLYLVKNKFDFVVDNVTVIPWFTPLYCNAPKTAIIHQLVQEIFFHELPLYKAAIAYRLEPKFFMPYRNIPIVCPGGQSTIRALREIGIPKLNIVDIPGGCPPEFINKCKSAWSRKAHFPLMVMLTRLEAYKHVDWAIMAFAKVKRELPKAKFVIAGWGKQEQKLRELVNSLGLQKDIEFVGRVEGDKKMRLLMSAYVHLWSLAPLDGCGLSIIEANACGTPSLAWRVPGPKDTIINGRTGFLLPYGDVDGLANKMKEILINQNLARRLSMKAQKWASQNTWDHVADKFRKHIEHCLGS
jgi:glycosyltransferase involved in cell wall biosynthesis